MTRACIDCLTAAPQTSKVNSLISSRGWRVVRKRGPGGEVVLQWRCPSCWEAHKQHTGAVEGPQPGTAAWASMSLAPTSLHDAREAGLVGEAEPTGETLRTLAPDADLAVGSTAERYVILSALGKGGSASVYAAYDPQLDRKVALKVLRSAAAPEDAGKEWQTRFAREAQAMARLSHPNVVTVFDAGVLGDGRVFLAMEIAEGGTLVAWMAGRQRSWREIVKVFCEAGEGLAAAHRAGVIHRDFKLDNVLVGSDGRPRVTDFGLAHFGDEAVPTLLPIGGSWSGHSLAGSLTQTGTLLGTPGYMAPEQFGVSGGIDARADVFSFCATLYRALYGERAFDGDTVEDIAEATLSGRVRAAPRSSEVPNWLRRVLLQGLSVERELRPASMPELLAALRSDPARRRWRWLAAATVVALAGSLVFGVRAGEQRRLRACHAVGDRLGGVWDGPHRAAVEEAFRSTGLGYAADTGKKVERELDAYGAVWSSSAEEACLATRVRGEHSEAMLELQLACLDNHLDELRALSDTFVRADSVTVQHAVEATHALSPVASCADLDRVSVSARLPTDVSARAEIRELQGEVAAAKALVDSGKELQSLAQLRTIHARVQAAGYGPLLVGWTLAAARAETASDPKAAQADFQQAAALADEQRLDAQRAAAEIALGDLAHLAARFEDSHRWLMLAGATIGRMGGDLPLEVRRNAREGWAFDCENKYAEAVPLFERALEGLRGVPSKDPQVVADAHSGLADALVAQGRFDEALEHLEASVQTVTEAYGPLHPAVAEQTNNLATAELQAGRVDESVATASRALAMIEAAVQRRDIAPTSGLIGDAAQTLGAALLRLRRPHDAVEQLVRAHDLFQVTGVREDMVALADNDLAEARHMLGDAPAAYAALAEANKIELANQGIPLETVAGTLVVGAKLAIDEGRFAEAVSFGAQALKLFDQCEPDAHDLADGRLVYARALGSGAHDPGPARALAEQARGAFERVHDSERATEASGLLAQLSSR